MSRTVTLFVDQEELRLTAKGAWLSNGQEITHGQTCLMLAKHLVRTGERWEIALGNERKEVIIEDTPYFVTGLEGSASTGFELRLSDESREKLDPATLRYGPEGRLVCRVKCGAFEARVLQPAYLQLLDGLEKDENGYFLTLSGKRIDLQ